MTTNNNAVIEQLKAENHELKLINQNLKNSNKSYSSVLERLVIVERQKDELAEALRQIEVWSDDYNAEQMLEKIGRKAASVLANLKTYSSQNTESERQKQPKEK